MPSAQRKNDFITDTPQPKKRKVRQVRMVGNVAYLDRNYERARAESKRAAQRKHAKKRKGSLVSTLFVLVVAFAALAVLVSRYAAVCSIASQNNELKQQITQAEAKISTMEVDLELRENIETVQETAQTRLGMGYPSQQQKITIDLNN